MSIRGNVLGIAESGNWNHSRNDNIDSGFYISQAHGNYPHILNRFIDQRKPLLFINLFVSLLFLEGFPIFIAGFNQFFNFPESIGFINFIAIM